MKTSLVILLVIPFALRSQFYQFEVVFKDKDSLTFNLTDPSSFLTPRAIERKNKYDIDVTISDYPITLAYLDSLNQYFDVKSSSKWFNLSTIQTADSLSVDTLLCFSFVKTFKFIGTTGSEFSRNSSISKITAIDYGAAASAIKQVKGDALHDQGYLGNGLTIAVLDAGFAKVNTMSIFSHLFDTEKILGTKSFVKGHSNVYGEDAHGTQVLSVLAGNKENEYVGTAPKANYLLLITEDTRQENLIEEYLWVSGAEFADSMGADIINSSLGYNQFDTKSQNHQYMDMGNQIAMVSKGAKKSAEKGMLVVNSAGNEGETAWKHLLFPADEEMVLSVGAVNDAGNYATFSSSSPQTLSFVKPNVAALGQQVSVSSTDGQYVKENGTSFSCPIIAGLAACLWESLPQSSQGEIKSMIEESGHQYGNPDRLLGYGVPDFSSIIPAGLSNENNSKLIVYPNPSQGNTFTIKNPVRSNFFQILLYDPVGHEINGISLVKLNATATALKIPQLTKGTYFLQITNSSCTVVKQLIIN